MSGAEGKMRKGVKRKCLNLTASAKLNILNRISSGESLKQLAAEFNITEKTITEWSKKRESLEKLNKEGGVLQTKRQRKPNFEILESALYVWFHETRLRGLPLNGPIIKRKAMQLYENMEIVDKFVASDGWLRNWKARHKIRQILNKGETMPADSAAAEDFKKKFPEIMETKKLTLQQIFNFDEFGIFSKMLPSRTLAESNERQAPGFKGSKDRYTVGVCSNMVGSCKLPLIMIGKSKNPRVLKNISKNTLPVYYANEKNGWLTSDIFETWFKSEFVPFVKAFLDDQGLPHKALLLLDNAPCHPDKDVLKVDDIEVMFFPDNTTSLIQPVDQGIIATIKRYYRFKLLSTVLDNQEKGIDISDSLKSVNIKNVIDWISDAWHEVRTDTIFNCWKPLLINSANFSKEEVSVSSTKKELSNKDVMLVLNKLESYENISSDNVNDWIDNDNKFCEIPTDAQIIDEVSKVKTEDLVEESTCMDQALVLPKIEREEAISAASTLISYFQMYGGIGRSEFSAIQRAAFILKNQ